MAYLTFRQWCEINNRKMLEYWDEDKNAALTPDDIPASDGRKKVWWICPDKHSYEATVRSQILGIGCPYCSVRKLLKGFNDLATVCPDLARNWNYKKNGDLTPSDVTYKSGRKVWWVCAKGHEWEAEIRLRNSGAGCPICINRKLLLGYNDLATTNPKLASEWSDKNLIGPESVTAGSNREVWWKCPKGHEWKASVAARSNGKRSCPVCANCVIIPGENDFSSLFPEIAKEWNDEKNGDLKPNQISPKNGIRVWWKCEKGHEWQAPVGRRTVTKTGCPYCKGRKVQKGFNDLATVEPDIAAEWAYDLNGDITPQTVTKGSRAKVWWRCPLGHVWQTKVSARTGRGRHGCPVCARIALSEKTKMRARRIDELLEKDRIEAEIRKAASVKKES